MKRAFFYFTTILVLFAENCVAQNSETHNYNTAKNLELFNNIYKNLDLYYVDTLDASIVVGNAINYMLLTLDPYTAYYDEKESKDLKSALTGKFAGIGSIIKYSFKNQAVVIEEPSEGMPAAKAGLKKGDIILSINDSSMLKKSVSYVSNRLRGDAGTQLMLKVKRPSTGKTLRFKITRQLIETPSVPFYDIIDNGTIGIIQLESFTENSSKEVRKAFLELKKRGMTSLVLDLRGNGGGSEQEAVKIVNIFVDKDQPVVWNQGKNKRSKKEFRTTTSPLDNQIPIVVLVNGTSASASEITSGALQDFDRAVILGERTYGKGLVQVTMDLPYNSMMKLTTGKYYIPSGRCIQAIKYKHGSGGYVEHIPDSLAKEFKTKNGRIVKDAGGITPDIKLESDSMANITYYLFAADTTEIVSNYVYNYINKHDKIASPKEFHLSDADFEEFKQSVMNSNFTYDKETEKQLKKLIDYAKFEGYYEEAKQEFENLDKKLKHNVEKDLDFNKEQITYLIENEIVRAYYYAKGGREHSLIFDKQLKEACKILNNPEEYRKILSPPSLN